MGVFSLSATTIAILAIVAAMLIIVAVMLFLLFDLELAPLVIGLIAIPIVLVLLASWWTSVGWDARGGGIIILLGALTVVGVVSAGSQ